MQIRQPFQTGQAARCQQLLGGVQRHVAPGVRRPRWPRAAVRVATKVDNQSSNNSSGSSPAAAPSVPHDALINGTGLARRVFEANPGIEGDPLQFLKVTEAYWRVLKQQKHQPNTPGPTVITVHTTPLPPCANPNAPDSSTTPTPTSSTSSSTSSSSTGPQPPQPVPQPHPVYDVIMCGGTLGLMVAAALQRRGHRVAVVERRRAEGRTQEWNSSQAEMQALVELDLLTPEELDDVIVTRYSPVRVGFHGGQDIWAQGCLDIGVNPKALLALLRQKFEAAGGVVFEHTAFKAARVHSDGVRVRLVPAKDLAGEVGDTNRPTALATHGPKGAATAANSAATPAAAAGQPAAAAVQPAPSAAASAAVPPPPPPPAFPAAPSAAPARSVAAVRAPEVPASARAAVAAASSSRIRARALATRPTWPPQQGVAAAVGNAGGVVGTAAGVGTAGGVAAGVGTAGAGVGTAGGVAVSAPRATAPTHWPSLSEKTGASSSWAHRPAAAAAQHSHTKGQVHSSSSSSSNGLVGASSSLLQGAGSRSRSSLDPIHSSNGRQATSSPLASVPAASAAAAPAASNPSAAPVPAAAPSAAAAPVPAADPSAAAAPSELRGRLLLDCMGHYSPIVKQVRGKAKPDGMVIVVGGCAEGVPEEKNKTADLLYTVADASSDLQLFWEAFPAESGNARTTYMFAYTDAHPSRPSFEQLLDAYFEQLPQYQGVPLDQLKFKRVLFGGFPSYSNGPLQSKFDRVLQLGDASATQSPLSFGGFGCMLRHCTRLVNAIGQALDQDKLTKGDLALIQPYQPSLSAAWLFQRSMSLKPGQLAAAAAAAPGKQQHQLPKADAAAANSPQVVKVGADQPSLSGSAGMTPGGPWPPTVAAAATQQQPLETPVGAGRFPVAPGAPAVSIKVKLPTSVAAAVTGCTQGIQQLAREVASSSRDAAAAAAQVGATAWGMTAAALAEAAALAATAAAQPATAGATAGATASAMFKPWGLGSRDIQPSTAGSSSKATLASTSTSSSSSGAGQATFSSTGGQANTAATQQQQSSTTAGAGGGASGATPASHTAAAAAAAKAAARMPKWAKLPANHINALLACNFAVMQVLGERVMKPFLQDSLQLVPLALSMVGMMLKSPLVISRVLIQVGPKVLCAWFVHFAALALYTAASLVLEPLRRFTNNYYVHRWLDAFKYGASLDYRFHPAAANQHPPARAAAAAAAANQQAAPATAAATRRVAPAAAPAAAAVAHQQTAPAAANKQAAPTAAAAIAAAAANQQATPAAAAAAAAVASQQATPAAARPAGPVRQQHNARQEQPLASASATPALEQLGQTAAADHLPAQHQRHHQHHHHQQQQQQEEDMYNNILSMDGLTSAPFAGPLGPSADVAGGSPAQQAPHQGLEEQQPTIGRSKRQKLHAAAALKSVP